MKICIIGGTGYVGLATGVGHACFPIFVKFRNSSITFSSSPVLYATIFF